MKDYYSELKKYLTYKNLGSQLDKLETIKNNPVEVIKLYNMFSKDIKDYMRDSRYNINEGKKYVIKSEDKAAFINRLEKLGIAVDTYKIIDDKLDKTFSIEFNNPEVIDLINRMLKKSPKINKLKENINPVDVIKLDVPLFIRLLEYAREDAKTDMDLHDITENIISMSSEGRTLSMSDYNKIMSKKMTENFNPDDYEWENDPELLEVVSELGNYSYVKCKILTIDGEEEILYFYLDEDNMGICEASDSKGVIYIMECTAMNAGIDGYYITSINGDTLTAIN